MGFPRVHARCVEGIQGFESPLAYPCAFHILPHMELLAGSLFAWLEWLAWLAWLSWLFLAGLTLCVPSCPAAWRPAASAACSGGRWLGRWLGCCCCLPPRWPPGCLAFRWPPGCLAEILPGHSSYSPACDRACLPGTGWSGAKPSAALGPPGNRLHGHRRPGRPVGTRGRDGRPAQRPGRQAGPPGSPAEPGGLRTPPLRGPRPGSGAAGPQPVVVTGRCIASARRAKRNTMDKHMIHERKGIPN